MGPQQAGPNMPLILAHLTKNLGVPVRQVGLKMKYFFFNKNQLLSGPSIEHVFHDWTNNLLLPDGKLDGFATLVSREIVSMVHVAPIHPWTP